jgi:hypothetical protein
MSEPYSPSPMRQPTPMVFVILNPTLPAGIRHASHAIVRAHRPRPHLVGSPAPIPTAQSGALSRATRIAQAFVGAAPERLVWGSDWPHPSVLTNKPNDALLFDLLMEWAPDVVTRNRILVQNPEILYGFPRT